MNRWRIHSRKYLKMETLEFKIIISKIKSSLNKPKNELESAEEMVSETERRSTKYCLTRSRKNTGKKE